MFTHSLILPYYFGRGGSYGIYVDVFLEQLWVYEVEGKAYLIPLLRGLLGRLFYNTFKPKLVGLKDLFY